MYLIQQITNDFLQKQTLTLPDGSTFDLTLYFMPLQNGWFIKNLTYNNFVLNNLRITNSPNILHQFKNQIPFGIACYSKDNREPTQQQDFSSGASKLYYLTSDEVTYFAQVLNGQVTP